MEVKLPAGWDEIIASGKYLEVIKILQTAYESPEHCKTALFFCLTGYDLAGQLNTVPLEKTSVSELVFAATLVDDVFPMLEFIVQRTPFFKCPLPVIWHNDKFYKGPEERLMNQTGAEWSISTHAEFMYHSTGDKAHLLHLVAANWHQVVNEKRSALTEEQEEQAVKELADIQEEVLWGAYLWYQHADFWWTKRFPHLFTGSEEGASPKATGMEVHNILFELAGNSLGDSWDKVPKRTRQDIIYALDRLESSRE